MLLHFLSQNPAYVKKLKLLPDSSASGKFLSLSHSSLLLKSLLFSPSSLLLREKFFLSGDFYWQGHIPPSISFWA